MIGYTRPWIDEKLTPGQYAAWALLGAPYAQLPPSSPLAELKKRIEQAVNWAVRDAQQERQ